MLSRSTPFWLTMHRNQKEGRRTMLEVAEEDEDCPIVDGVAEVVAEVAAGEDEDSELNCERNFGACFGTLLFRVTDCCR